MRCCFAAMAAASRCRLGISSPAAVVTAMLLLVVTHNLSPSPRSRMTGSRSQSRRETTTICAIAQRRAAQPTSNITSSHSMSFRRAVLQFRSSPSLSSPFISALLCTIQLNFVAVVYFLNKNISSVLCGVVKAVVNTAYTAGGCIYEA